MAENKPEIFRLEEGNLIIMGTKCARCNHRWFPPLYYGCEQCGAHGDELRPCDLSPKGHIYSYTTVPERDGGVFTLAQVVLDDGPAIRALISEPAPEELHIGDRVEGFTSGEKENLTITFRKTPS